MCVSHNKFLIINISRKKHQYCVRWPVLVAIVIVINISLRWPAFVAN